MTRGNLSRLRVAGLCALAFHAPASAFELSVPGEPIEVHGFASQGFIKTTDNNYLAESKRSSFEFTEVGLNFTKELTDRLRLGVQLFARRLGPLDGFDAKFDWFYLDYRWADWLGIRAGRVKLPFGLYNEINDIDSARVPILLPQSIYPTSNRDFLLAQTGGEIYGRVSLSLAGALEYRTYAGTIFLQSTTQPNSPYQVGKLNAPYVVGGRILWESPLEGLRVGGSLQALRLDADLFFDQSLYGPLRMAGALPPDFTGKVSAEIPAILWVGSAEYSAGALLLAAEYSRWYVQATSTQSVLFPNISTMVSERFYGMLAYRVKQWFHPGLYYSGYYTNIGNRSGRENMQHDVAATLRFDINQYWLVKLEGHFMHGTAALDPSLNDNRRLSDLQANWGLLLLKTTAYF